MIALLYATKIVMEEINRKTSEPWSFNDVPYKLKDQVRDLLISEFDREDLVEV